MLLAGLGEAIVAEELSSERTQKKNLLSQIDPVQLDLQVDDCHCHLDNKSIYCAIVVFGAEVGADTVSCFGGGSASHVPVRQAGLGLVSVAGAAVEACVLCVQEGLGKVWLLLRKASELI
ncbi:hypothetical protein EYF80_010020 [Liparis tanakae]|uniref:Uncharacterized protein n=1 Tax=Liparis tanakae TaxID=230148 RepID=A0A4Z2IPJ3_9TELE|nr:hypothetical protein EYF80_010020 [Liparis tanakae]